MKPLMRTAATLGLASLLLLSCTAKIVVPKPQLGSPAHHVENGFKLLEMEKIEAAFREFKMAEEIDPGLSAAHLGTGLCLAYRGEYQKGLASLETAGRKAKGSAQQIDALTGFMRLYTLGNTALKADWLKEVENTFEKTQQLDPEAPGPHFFMGIAYKRAGQYDAATLAFIRVFEIGKEYVEAADREYTTVQKLKKTASP